jgi:ABC-2 type transport system permease protein
VTAGTTLVVLVATGALTALVAPRVLTGPDVAAHAFAAVAGQWPAAVAVTGWAALLAGRWPRGLWLAWLPTAAGGVVALLGGILGVPDRVQDLGLFAQAPDAADLSQALGPLALVALAGAAAALGVAGFARRDVAAA